MDTRGPWDLAGEDADGLLVGLSCIPWSCRVPEAAPSPPTEKGAHGDTTSLLGPHGLSCPLESVFTDHRTTDTPSFVTFFFLFVLIFYILTCPANHTPFISWSASRGPWQAVCLSGAELPWGGQGTPRGFPPLHAMTTTTGDRPG